MMERRVKIPSGSLFRQNLSRDMCDLELLACFLLVCCNQLVVGLKGKFYWRSRRSQRKVTYKVIHFYAESLARKLGSGKMGKSVGQEPSGVYASGLGYFGVSNTVDSDLSVRKIPS